MSGRRGVLLDVDGTLIDNSYLHTLAWSRTLREDGRTETMARLHRLVGMGGEMYTRELYGAPRDDLQEAHSRHIHELWDDMAPLPGAAELVHCIHDAGLQVVLSTSGGGDDVQRLIAMLGVRELIDHVASGDDVQNTKPAPDVVAVALQKSGLATDDAVFVGDTRWDVEAAGRAGLRCIGVETGGWAPHELEEAGAVAVYRDAHELASRFEDSLLGELARG